MAIAIKEMTESFSTASLEKNDQADARIIEIFINEQFATKFEGFLTEQGLLSFGEILGKGNYGTVFSVAVQCGSALLGNNNDQTEIAIKVISREKAKECPKSFLIARDRRGGEAVALGFPENPHLLKTFSLITYNFEKETFQLQSGDLSTVDNEHILAVVMEKVDDYQELLKCCIFDNPDLIKKITKEVLIGLEALHRANFIHRDIKPDNIMVYLKRNTRDVKIIDYGLARNLSETKHSRTRSRSGSGNYVAPEVLKGDEQEDEGYDQTVDIFSLGALVYAIAFSRAPFDPKNNASIQESLANLLEFKKSKSTIKEYHDLQNFNKDIYPLEKDLNFWGFLNKVLESDPQKRLTAEQALQHPFLQ